MPDKKTKVTRIIEIFLSLGIPAAGYIYAGGAFNDRLLFWRIPLILFAAWHVICINDESFAENSSLKSIFLGHENKIEALFIPFLIIVTLPGAPLFNFLILLTMLNWDIYSISGKRAWAAGLLHNFAGGALHFFIGTAAATPAGYADFRQFAVPALFFAFMMASGGMHHDSYDKDEDQSLGYETGAVRFSPDKWWRLAALPFLAGTALLFFCDDIFRKAFILPAVVYIIAYSATVVKKNPSHSKYFRTICRLSFICAAILFFLLKKQYF